MSERFIAEEVEVHLDERLLSARPLGGGCIGEVYRVEVEGGPPLVAKLDRETASHLERETYMLRYLREKSNLPVPEVYYGSKELLLMEFVEGESRFSKEAERHAAELLAGLHSIGADAYGHERDTLIGSLNQLNLPTRSWVEFFRDERLLYAADMAREAGRLPSGERRRIDLLAEKLEDFIGEAEKPSLVHGDVWRANVLAKGDRVTAFLDPAIYHADPEIELAYISLFDTFGETFFERYAEITPLRPGFFESRRDLYTLYPLLVHVYYFGGSYVGMVGKVLDGFGV